jgi:hypothetical protein
MLIQSLIWFEWLTGWELWRHGDDACTPLASAGGLSIFTATK